MTDLPEHINLRLRELEASMDVQAQILTDIQQELLEADRLTDSVARLGEGANTLGTALLRVDAQQQTLTKLGLELQRVEETAATTEDVEEKVRLAKQELGVKRAAERRSTWRWLIGSILVIAFIAGGISQYLHDERDQRVAECRRSQATTTAVVGYLEDVARSSEVPRIRQSAQDVIDSLRARSPKECT